MWAWNNLYGLSFQEAQSGMFQKWWCNKKELSVCRDEETEDVWLICDQPVARYSTNSAPFVCLGHCSISMQETNYDVHISEKVFFFFLRQTQTDWTFLSLSDLIFSEVWFQWLMAETMTPAEVETTVCWVSSRAQRDFIILKDLRIINSLKEFLPWQPLLDLYFQALHGTVQNPTRYSLKSGYK